MTPQTAFYEVYKEFNKISNDKMTGIDVGYCKDEVLDKRENLKDFWTTI